MSKFDKDQEYFNQLNYVRTTPLNMVCRDPDREYLTRNYEYDMNNIPEEQIRLPLAESQSIRNEASTASHYDKDNSPIHVQNGKFYLSQNGINNSLNLVQAPSDNMITEEIGKHSPLLKSI